MVDLKQNRFNHFYLLYSILLWTICISLLDSVFLHCIRFCVCVYAESGEKERKILLLYTACNHLILLSNLHFFLNAFCVLNCSTNTSTVCWYKRVDNKPIGFALPKAWFPFLSPKMSLLVNRSYSRNNNKKKNVYNFDDDFCMYD